MTFCANTILTFCADNKMIKKEDLVAPKEENRAYDLSNESNKGKTKQEPIETLDISDDETKNDVDLKNKINENNVNEEYKDKLNENKVKLASEIYQKIKNEYESYKENKMNKISLNEDNKIKNNDKPVSKSTRQEWTNIEEIYLYIGVELFKKGNRIDWNSIRNEIETIFINRKNDHLKDKYRNLQKTKNFNIIVKRVQEIIESINNNKTN